MQFTWVRMRALLSRWRVGTGYVALPESRQVTLEPRNHGERLRAKHPMVPSFPVGATIGSIQSALVAIGRFSSLESSRTRIYGVRAVPENKFGFLADEFAANALDGSMSGSDLIEQYTAFPIYASLLAPESRAMWKSAQLAGERSAWARYFPARVHGEVFGPVSRLCPACVEVDRTDFGMGFWRVEHQLPAVTVCKAHGCVLHDHCADCGAAFPAGKDGRRPGLECTACGSMKSAALAKVKASPAVRAYAALIARAARSAAPELAPDVRV